MSERNAVQRAFDTWGHDSGYTKKSGSWYHATDEVISVSNLQKSQYAVRYYFNQGFWLRQLGDDKLPTSHRCQIWLRLNDLVAGSSNRLDQLLDMSHNFNDDERVEELIHLDEARLMPVIKLGETVIGLRTLLDQGAFKAAMVTGSARAVITETRGS